MSERIKEIEKKLKKARYNAKLKQSKLEDFGVKINVGQK